MNPFVYVVIFIYLILMVFYMFFKKSASFPVASLLKMSLSAIFLTLGIYGYYTCGFSIVKLLLLLALCCALCGDWFLRYLSRNAMKFNIGIVFFSLCQFFIIAMYMTINHFSYWIILTIFLTVINTFLLLKLLDSNKSNLGINLPFLQSYMFSMSLLISSAITFIIITPDFSTFNTLILFGGALFFLSDILLGVYSYIYKKRILTMLNSLTYFCGMLLFSISLII